MDKTYWDFGDLTELAELTGTTRAHVCDAVHRRRSFRKAKARRFSEACAKLGKTVPASEWMNTPDSFHPAFLPPKDDSYLLE